MKKTIEQLSIFVENSQGRMAEITQVIADAGVDIRALSVADTSDFGILRLIVNQPDAATKALQAAGVMVSITEVIAVGIEDKPGAFSHVISLISKAGINIEYMYAFISRTDNQAFVIMRVDDCTAGTEALEKEGISLLTSEQVYDL